MADLAQQFTLHSAEAYSQPYQTSKQGGYLLRVNCCHKKLDLRCLAGF